MLANLKDSFGGVFLLAAGKGTRMGLLGQRLPKLRWPVFDNELLELQVNYWRSITNSKIFINIHNFKDEFYNLPYLTKSYIHLIHEPTTLGVGGAIHNLAKEFGYKKKYIITASDQFFLIEKNIILKDISEIKDNMHLLYGVKTNKQNAHSMVLYNTDGVITQIIPVNQIEHNITNYETYSGLGIVNFSLLNKIEGESNFFDTVTKIGDPATRFRFENAAYWDYGTLYRYKNSILNTFKDFFLEQSMEFLDILVSINAIKTNRFKKNKNFYSYNAKNFNFYCNLDFSNILISDVLLPLEIINENLKKNSFFIFQKDQFDLQ